MRRKLALIVAALLAAGAAVGPAASAGKSDVPAKPADQCFHTSRIQGFAAPDDKNLYIRTGIRDVFHLTLLDHCTDLDWDQAVGLVSRNGSNFICDQSDIEIVAHSRGLGPQHCAVRAMEKLTPEQVAALPKRAKP